MINIFLEKISLWWFTGKCHFLSDLAEMSQMITNKWKIYLQKSFKDMLFSRIFLIVSEVVPF